jgi:hypothetical protein
VESIASIASIAFMIHDETSRAAVLPSAGLPACADMQAYQRACTSKEDIQYSRYRYTRMKASLKVDVCKVKHSYLNERVTGRILEPDWRTQVYKRARPRHFPVG